MIAAYTTASVAPEITLTYGRLPRGESWAMLTRPTEAPWRAWKVGDRLDVRLIYSGRTMATQVVITSIKRVGDQFEVRGDAAASPYHATIWHSVSDG